MTISNAKILIVENEGIEALDLQRRLMGLGYPCPEIASTGDEAIEMAGQMCPDLILMDIMLSGEIDGITAAEQIRARFDIPVIYLTAYADESTVRRAKVTEPYGYIVKPSQEREIHITIDIALYKHDMERRLKESRQWFATTLRSIGDAVIATDHNGRVTFMNAIAEGLTGWNFDQAAQQKLTEIFKIVNRDTRKPVENPVSKVLIKGTIVGLANHTILVARDGTEIPIDDSAAPLKDEKGNIIGVVLVFRDVTEKQKAEKQMQEANESLRTQAEELITANKALRESENALRQRTLELQQLTGTLEQRVRERTAELSKANEALSRAGAYNRSLIEASLDPLATIGPDGKITDVNAATEAVTGCTRDKLIGTDFSDYFTSPEKAREGYQKVFQEGAVQDYPLEIRHKSGRLTEVLYNATVYRDQQRNPIGVFAAARDVTELRRAEQAVRAERGRLNDVLETLPAYLVLLAPDYRVPFANRFFRERFGESNGRRCFEYLFGRTEPCEICETYKVLKTNKPHHWEWTGPDGRNYDVYDFPFTDTDGSPLIMEMGIDITDRKRAEQEVRKLNEELERRVAQRTAELEAANKEMEAFSYSVSHDLRGPLRAIDGFSHAIIEDYGHVLDDTAKDYLGRVRNGAQKMSDLIDALLSLSRLTRSNLKRSKVDFTAIVSEIADDLKRIQPERQVDFVIQDNVTGFADKGMIRSLLDNLLRNAWKFTAKHERARIEFGVQQSEKEQVYFVRDDGAGFNMDYQNRLFKAFQRLHRDNEFAGIGIGLATVQRIVNRHGGRIWAEGEVEKGATFYFTLGNEQK